MSQVPDAAQDAANELQRQEAAQNFELPDTAAVPAPPLFAPEPLQSPYQQAGPAPEANGGSPRTLEDLYQLFPLLGRGEWKLRITRTRPRAFRGCSTAGYLGDLFERLSMEEFKTEFGGGDYVAAVMRPVSDGDHATKSDYRQVKAIKFRLPGDPTLRGIPGNEDDDMANMAMKFSPQQFGAPSDAVQIERMKIESRRSEQDRADRIRLEQRVDTVRQGAQMPDSTLRHYADTTRVVVDDIKEQSAAQQMFWQQEVERMRSELNVREQELREARDRLAKAESEASNTSRNIETAAMREMKDRYEEQIRTQREGAEERVREAKDRGEEDRRRLLEEQQRKTDELGSDNRRVVEEITRRHDESARREQTEQGRERERIRDEARTRVEQVERDRDNQVRTMRENHEARIDDLRRSTEREMTTLRDQTRREIEGVKQSERMTATLTKETSGNRVNMMEHELNRVRADAERSGREVSELREKQHKEPLEAIQEAHALSAMTGMVDASEAEPGEQSLTQQIISLGKQAVEKVPDILDSFAKARQQTQQNNAAQGRPQYQQQQPRALPQGQPRYAPPPMQQQQQQQQPQQQQQQQRAYQPPPAPQPQQPRYNPPPMGTGVPMAAGHVGTVPFAPDTPTIASPVQPASADPEQQMPLGSDAPVTVESQPAHYRRVAPPPDGAPAAQQEQPPETGPLHPNLPRDAVVKFFSELEGAVAGDVIPPDVFADGFVGRVGAPMATSLLQYYAPEDIVRTAQQLASDSAIVTRRGQRYVTAVWNHASAKLQAGQYPQGPPEQQAPPPEQPAAPPAEQAPVPPSQDPPEPGASPEESAPQLSASGESMAPPLQAGADDSAAE